MRLVNEIVVFIVFRRLFVFRFSCSAIPRPKKSWARSADGLVPLRTMLLMSTMNLWLAAAAQSSLPLFWLLRPSPPLPRQLSSSPRPQLLRPRDFYLLPRLRLDEFCDSTHSASPTLPCAGAVDRSVRVYSARIPCPS